MVNTTQVKATGEKRQAILNTALRLFVEQGFHSTSTASIAKHAGVATGTLFHHFSSKSALMDELFLSIKQEFANDIVMHVSAPFKGDAASVADNDVSEGNLSVADESTIDENSVDVSTFKLEAEHIWQRAIDWALNNPLKQRFFLQYSMSSEVTLAARNQAMTSILGFITRLLTQGQTLGFIARYPIALMLENCHGQYLASIRFFTDNPALGQDPQYRQASFALFWRAIRG
jgi:AcrR family transcriptional regulator